jgi:hypothetical protein
VKRCSYCGRENEEAATVCRECGTELADSHTARAPETEDPLVRTALPPGLCGLDMGFTEVDGFSRPNWKSINAFVKRTVPECDLSLAWTWIAKRWLEQLACDLGGTYRVQSSTNFLCLVDLKGEECEFLLPCAERTLSVIRDLLGEAAWRGFYGSHVLLIFSEEDDYYSYIAPFYAAGNHARSGGIFIRRGYAHVAIPHVTLRYTEQVLVHELTHNLLCHLKIPLWLNEGIAQRAEELMSRARFLLNQEIVQRHYEFWNAQNIQEFWAGVSFDRSDGVNELSYGLARILVSLLAERGASFSDFVQHAEYADSGQDAALKFLGSDLGKTMGEFLGPGNWQPQRLAISKILQPAKQARSSDSASP